MEAAPLVTLIAVGVAIAVIAAFLITVVYQLYQVFARLNTVLGVVGGVVQQTAVLEPIISEIADDLAGGETSLVAAVDDLKRRMGHDESGEDSGRPAGAGVGLIPSAPPPPTGFSNY
jgi:hypothetical protein